MSTSPPSSTDDTGSPITARTEYKVSLLTFQCIHGNTILYLAELLTAYTTTRSLRSSNTHRLLRPRTETPTMGERDFLLYPSMSVDHDNPRAPQSFLFKRPFHF